MELVNDEFWLGYAKTKIADGLEALNTTADNLSKLIGIFWGIYTLLFTAGTALIQIKASQFVIGMLTSPIALLMAAYCFAQWAQLPIVSKGVDPRIPRQVEALYKKTITKKTIRLFLASTITFVSALMIAIALIASNFLQSKSGESGAFDIAFDKNGKNANVLISGELPEKSIVWVDIQTIFDATDSTEKIVRNYPRYHNVVTRDNHFDYASLIFPWPDTLSVTVYWKEKEGATVIHSLMESSPEN